MKLSAERTPSGNGNEIGVDPVLFETDVRSFLKNPELWAEVFGPATLLIRHSNRADLLDVARNLKAI